MPPGLYIHTSNRLELLAEALAWQLRHEPSPPLQAERIVVPHPVLGRWLQLQLATELGIAAHLQVELPAEFAWSIMGAALPNLPVANPFAPASLRWRIYDVLSRLMGCSRAASEPLRSDPELARYLADGEPRKRFELAARLAHLYDPCLLYRPDWIRAWQTPPANHAANASLAAADGVASGGWPAQLWAQLANADGGAQHWADVVAAYCAAAASTSSRAARLNLPFADDKDRGKSNGSDCLRASFFAVYSLSPSYLDVLRSAARTMAIHLYLPSPCREFWADTRSPRERPAVAADDGYYDEGNELLSAWGRTARDMQASLADDLGAGAPTENYAEPAANTRLAALQRDVLNLRGKDEPAAAHPPADDSLQIHICHSAMREAEVIHDRLLGLFDAHPHIQPADVLILTPSLDTYAPAIESVFSANGLVPFNLGRQRRRDSAAVQAFIDLLDLVGSRYAASAVLAPLQASAVRARFGIAEGELALVRGWLDAAGIRWGIDAEHLQTQGLPQATHTWRDGLRRLILGYATAESATVFLGVTPCALDTGGFDASSADYERLGRFARYCEQVVELDRWQHRERTPRNWAKDLRDIVLARFFVDRPGSDASEVDAVATLIDLFVDECTSAGELAPIPFAVVRDALAARAEEATRSVVRLADGATVGQLAAGQVFPAEVVCAVGMSDRLFPRHPATASFDPMAAGARRIGDRDVRDEDRYAFLEALLAARHSFVVTYTGRDLREDTALPPSAVVSELLEYLDARFVDGRAMHETRHPLQPFSRRYFQPPADTTPTASGAGALFSYSAAMASAANALGRLHDELPDRFAAPLPVATNRQTSKDIVLDELCRFAIAPVRYFVERRLGVRLDARVDELADEEVLQLDARRAWQLKNDLFYLEDRAGVVEPDLARCILLARGRLPEGNPGRLAQQQAGREVAALAEALRPFAKHRQAPPYAIDVVAKGGNLVGSVTQFLLPRHELLHWRIGAIRPQQRIAAWLRLLAATCATGHGVAATLIGIDKVVQVERIEGPAPDAARAALEDWLQAWHEGQTQALPFFSETSWRWATKGESEARKAWTGNQWGEADDVHHRLVFPEGPFNHRRQPAFEALAKRLLAPLAMATAE